MESFWKTMNKPVFALAPMEDVTDTVFREIILSVSDPSILSIVFTEFTSTDGLCHPQGMKSAMARLKVNETEKKFLEKNQIRLVAQIWGSDPEKFYKSARMISEMGLFDGIDINMGCPVKKVVNHLSCSALITDPGRAVSIIEATKEGSKLPVSVKTRLGFKTVVTESWIGRLLDANPEAITIHGRTQKMMSEGDVLWEEIRKAVQLKNHKHSSTILLGNGDIWNYADGLDKISECQLDGIMIGRGVFKNPWVFNKGEVSPSISEHLNLLRNHLALYKITWENGNNYNALKRFFKIYLHGFPDAGNLRSKMMETTNAQEAIQLLDQFNYTELAK